ncbi:mitochondrial import receptor subunit TOM20 [Tanacetum coccineum]
MPCISFQKAVDESPENELYLRCLAACAKAPALHKEIHTGAASWPQGSVKNKSFFRLVIIFVGIFTWMAKSRVPRPPAR